jgi:hypothetical protein
MSNHDNHDVDEPVLQEEYYCSDQELEQAGFTIRHLDEMPETDPEVITDPREQLEHLERRHGFADLAERFPIERFGAMLELVELFNLDPRRAASWHPCRAL